MSEYLPQEKFADRMESLYVGMCVALGHMERRPFSVSKLAAYLEAPRTTVLRQLDHLVERGVIARRGHHYFMNEERANQPSAMKAHDRLMRLVRQTAAQLSETNISRAA